MTGNNDRYTPEQLANRRGCLYPVLIGLGISTVLWALVALFGGTSAGDRQTCIEANRIFKTAHDC